MIVLLWMACLDYQFIGGSHPDTALDTAGLGRSLLAPDRLAAEPPPVRGDCTDELPDLFEVQAAACPADPARLALELSLGDICVASCLSESLLDLRLGNTSTAADVVELEVALYSTEGHELGRAGMASPDSGHGFHVRFIVDTQVLMAGVEAHMEAVELDRLCEQSQVSWTWSAEQWGADPPC